MKLDILADQLIEKYGSFTTEHCGELKKEVYEKVQEESYDKQIKLAKEKDKDIRLCAHLKELDTC